MSSRGSCFHSTFFGGDEKSRTYLARSLVRFLGGLLKTTTPYRIYKQSWRVFWNYVPSLRREEAEISIVGDSSIKLVNRKESTPLIRRTSITSWFQTFTPCQSSTNIKCIPRSHTRKSCATSKSTWKGSSSKSWHTEITSNPVSSTWKITNKSIFKFKPKELTTKVKSNSQVPPKESPNKTTTS